MNRWYLIYSHFKQEDKVVYNLRKQNFECLLFKISSDKNSKKNQVLKK